MAVLHDPSPPAVTRAVSHHGQQPAGKQRLVDRVQVPVERQKGLGRQVLRFFPAARHAPGKSIDRLDVLAVKVLETPHAGYGLRPGLEDFSRRLLQSGARRLLRAPTIRATESAVNCRPIASPAAYSPRCQHVERPVRIQERPLAEPGPPRGPLPRALKWPTTQQFVGVGVMAIKSLSRCTAALITASCLSASGLLAQTEIKLPKNRYTPQQDVELGRQAAAEIRQQYPIIKDERIARYLTALGDRLVAAAPAELKQAGLRIFVYPGEPERDQRLRASRRPDVRLPRHVRRGRDRGRSRRA